MTMRMLHTSMKGGVRNLVHWTIPFAIDQAHLQVCTCLTAPPSARRIGGSTAHTCTTVLRFN
jgi:hypothetical protein